MIYLLLVVVFSKIFKQWWPFLLIGWGTLECDIDITYEDLVISMILKFTDSISNLYTVYAIVLSLLGLPLIIVAIAAGVAHEQYGVKNQFQ